MTLSQSYFRYFEGREYTDIRTFLIITQEAGKNMFVKYDPKKWLDFHAKVAKVCDILSDKNIWYYKLNKNDVSDYLHRFMTINFKDGAFSVNNFKASDEFLTIGDRAVRSFSLVDVDVIDMPTVVKPYLLPHRHRSVRLHDQCSFCRLHHLQSGHPDSSPTEAEAQAGEQVEASRLHA